MWFAVEDDLRFASHHDMMRVIERTAIRAQLPLHYSQGFNPHPVIVLVCPKAVGVGTRGDLLVVGLDCPISGGELLEKFSAQTPRGMRVLSAEPLTGKKIPRVVGVCYELDLDEDRLDQVRRRQEELDSLESWWVDREYPSRKRKRPPATRRIDLKPLIDRLELRRSTLHIELVPQGDCWARPKEVLEKLGLDGRVDLGATVRTEIRLET